MASDRSLAPDPWPLTPDQWIEPSARNLAEVFAGTAGRGGFRTARWDDAWAADLRLPEPLVNTVTPLSPIADETAPDLSARLDEFFRQADGGAWTVWSAWPAPALTALGYDLIGEPPLMVRAPGSEPATAPDALRIREARTAEELAIFERTFIDGYPAPALQPVEPGCMFRPGALGGPVRFWIGSVDGGAVTVAVSCELEGVVGVYFVATLPEARGRGYGAAITDAAARANPSLPAVLQSSDLGRPVYERLGFRTVSRYSLWLRKRKR
jgi:GNAT superfamily N-acetyltransferase